MKTVTNINKDTVQKQVTEWAKNNLGSGFTFRQHQLDVICDILINILYDKNHTHIVEAPTGSGKSLICIISAGVLSEYYKLTSYILCSDLYLFGQYDNFIKANKLNFGALKGQTGNYYCDKNGEDMRNAECRIAKMAWSQLYRRDEADRHGFKCARYCTYLAERKKAQSSKVTLMTYQLYFYMINIVQYQLEHPPFMSRDVIFCDECHNIPSLVQNQYSPTIRKSDLEKLVELYKYNMRLTTADDLFAEESLCDRLPWNSVSELENVFNSMWDVFISENDKHNYDAIFSYIDFIAEFDETVEELEGELAGKRRISQKLDKKDMEMYKLTSWYRNYGCFLSDFSTAISNCGRDYLVKTLNPPKTDNGEPSVSFNCVKEDYMCWKYLLSTSSNNVLLSATVGDKEAYDDNVGTKYSEDSVSLMQRIPSTFDFSNSPVIVYGKYKMSYNYKATSFPRIKEMIYYIMNKYSDKRGIIQTGSYENAQEIYNSAPPQLKSRLQLYGSSSEKNWSIEMHKAIDNSVLIGPTLTEGVDLPDDLCRFIIIAKVPYPNLKDKLVKAKMKLFPKWYDSETANSIIQGIGRGNRNPSDWCVTYILDGCFNNLYNKTSSQFPIELQKRIKFM